MQKIYCLSGLGADERIFRNLHLPGYEMVHIPWPEFDHFDELGCYAQKVSVLIPGEDPIILGVSFGGMLGVEIAKMRPVKKLIIISSAKTKNEIPQFGKFFRALITSEAMPGFLYKIPNKYTFELFGAGTDEERNMLRDIMKDSYGQLMRWAMKAITLWRNETYPDHITHIHGDADKIIPPERIHPTHWIKGGSHIMVYNRADEIGHIIMKELSHADNI